MTDNVSPSRNETIYSYLLARTIHEHGDVGNGWIVPEDETVLADHANTSVVDAPYGAFRLYAINGLDITINHGEAFIGGAWVARDDRTSLTLAENTDNQTIYVGWRNDDGNRVIVGRETAFQDADVKLPLYTLHTNATEVYDWEDQRQIGRPEDASGEVSISDDGNQVIATAEAIDFQSDLDVSTSGSTAEVSIASKLARLTQDEEITGQWVFSDDVDYDSNNLLNVEEIHTVGGSNVTSYIYTPDSPDGRFVIRDPDGEQAILIAHNGGHVTIPNGALGVGNLYNDGSISIDIDTDNSSTAQAFSITHDQGDETLFTVAEDGTADLPQGGPFTADGVPLANLHDTITHTFPETELESGDEAVYKHYVPSGHDLSVYAWGATDGTGDASEVTVRVRKIGDSGSEVSQGTARHTGTPIESWTSNGDMFVFGIRNHANGARNVNGFVHAVIE